MAAAVVVLVKKKMAAGAAAEAAGVRHRKKLFAQNLHLPAPCMWIVSFPNSFLHLSCRRLVALVVPGHRYLGLASHRNKRETLWMLWLSK
jgi:hypothetical protein